MFPWKVEVDVYLRVLLIVPVEYAQVRQPVNVGVVKVCFCYKKYSHIGEMLAYIVHVPELVQAAPGASCTYGTPGGPTNRLCYSGCSQRSLDRTHFSSVPACDGIPVL